MGVDDYINKPFSSQEVLVRIKNLLYNYQQRKKWHKEAPNTTEEIAPQNEISPANLKWLKSVEEAIYQHISDKRLGVTMLAYEFSMSERQFRRRINSTTGLSPNKYIRELKLSYARNLLESGEYNTVAEVSYTIGFEKVAHFSKLYLNRFGKKASSYF
ncbi:MAG: helix-turn-helix domain-containing protein [Aureispira sp.]|nr:helix-turn-helix domain-containing protein [Aureispira sp.]